MQLTLANLIGFYFAIVLDSSIARDIATGINHQWIPNILAPILFYGVMIGLSISIPFIDPEEWLFHLYRNHYVRQNLYAQNEKNHLP